MVPREEYNLEIPIYRTKCENVIKLILYGCKSSHCVLRMLKGDAFCLHIQEGFVLLVGLWKSDCCVSRFS